MPVLTIMLSAHKHKLRYAASLSEATVISEHRCYESEKLVAWHTTQPDNERYVCLAKRLL